MIRCHCTVFQELTQKMPSAESSTPSDIFYNPWFYGALTLSGLLFFVIGLATGTYLRSNKPTIDSLLDTEVPGWLESARKNHSDKSLGNPNAAVTVVEYMDVECPFCERYSKRIFPRIVKEYVQPGKVHYKIRHFPLTRAHPNALKGGIAAECAAEQNKFWEFKTLALHNRQFLSPKLIRELGGIIDVPDFQQYKECVRNDKYRETVQDEFRQGRQQGVDGTPTVFINGESLAGVQSYSKYRGLIESALSQGPSS